MNVYMQELTGYFLGAHITSGFLALISGALAAFLKKGSKNHTRSGNVYFASMMGVAISATYISLAKELWFLLVVGLFSGYLALGGKLILRKTKEELRKKQWNVYSLFGLMIAGCMLYVTWLLFKQNNGSYIILAVFSASQLFVAIGDRRYLKEFSPKKHKIQHLNKMGAAYIATCTAFMVVNVTFLPSLAVWLTPTVVGTVLISVAGKKWKKKLGISKEEKKEAVSAS